MSYLNKMIATFLWMIFILMYLATVCSAVGMGALIYIGIPFKWWHLAPWWHLLYGVIVTCALVPPIVKYADVVGVPIENFLDAIWQTMNNFWDKE
jgi:hypothetical protein